MKRARIVLGAVAAFAILGGVFATQANTKRLSNYIYTRLNPAVNACTVKLEGFTSSTTTTTQTYVGTIFATSISGPCPATVRYYAAD